MLTYFRMSKKYPNAIPAGMEKTMPVIRRTPKQLNSVTLAWERDTASCGLCSKLKYKCVDVIPYSEGMVACLQCGKTMKSLTFRQKHQWKVCNFVGKDCECDLRRLVLITLNTIGLSQFEKRLLEFVC